MPAPLPSNPEPMSTALHLRLRLAFAAALGLLANTRPAAAAATPSEPLTPLVSKADKLLFADDFNALKPVWGVGKGDWKIVDGTARGGERPEDKHKAGIGHKEKLRDCVIRLVFALDGAKSVEISLIKLDAAGEREHVCRVAFGAESLKLYAQTGMGQTTKNILIGEQPMKLVPGQRYTALVECVGNRLVAQVSNGAVARGTSDVLAGEKESLNLTVNGTTGVFDEVKVWNALPQP